MLSLILISILLFFAAAALAVCAAKRYELAIALVLLSPWISCLSGSGRRPIGEESLRPDATSYVRIGVIMLMGTAGLLKYLAMRKSPSSVSRRHLHLLGVFLLYALLSTTYSIDKTYTLARSFEFLGFFFFLLGLHRWLESRRALETALNIYFAVCCLGILLNLFALGFPSDWAWWYVDRSRFQGVLNHPNSLGAFSMVAYPILAWKCRHTEFPVRFWMYVLFCITALCHVASGSRGTLVASFVGLAVWYIVAGERRRLAVLACALVVGAAVFFWVRPVGLQRDSGNVLDLMGRPSLWHHTVCLVAERRPLFGFGYGVSGRIWADSQFQSAGRYLWSGSAKADLHNGYLTVMAGLGMVGLLMWLCFTVMPLLPVLSMRAGTYKALVLAVAAQAFILNIAETSITSSRVLPSLVFWFFWLIAGRLPSLLSEQPCSAAEGCTVATGTRAFAAASPWSGHLCRS